MTAQDLAKLVKTMRAKQKEYFRHRQPSVLNECRDLERRVDLAAEAVLNPPTAGLFDQPQE